MRSRTGNFEEGSGRDERAVRVEESHGSSRVEGKGEDDLAGGAGRAER